MSVHPWRRLRALADVELLWHDGGPMGETNFDEQTISIRRGMTYEERRCTVLHECLHLERGQVPYGMLAAEEQKVSKATAHLMLPSWPVVVDVLAWAHCMEEAADELAVDLDTLLVRLRHLAPYEKKLLEQRFADLEMLTRQHMSASEGHLD